MRLAGTIREYSSSAMLQLASTATYQGRPLRFRRCAYQANVMKMFESTSSPAVRRRIEVSMGSSWCQSPPGVTSTPCAPGGG